MKFCEECGAQLDDDMRFCDECGTPVSDYEEVPQAVEKNNVQTEDAVQSEATVKQQETVEDTVGEVGGKTKRKLVFLTVIFGVLLLAVIIIGIVLLGKGRKGNDSEQESVKQENVTSEVDEPDESKTDAEKQDAVITETVIDGSKIDDSEIEEDTYPLLDEFISIVCSYSDPPPLEGDAYDEYFKELYDSWMSGDDFTNIIVGEDGHLELAEEHEIMFENATYAAYTVVSQVGNMEYGFRVTKENAYYFAELVYVNKYGRFMNALDFSQEGIFIGEENVASGIINEATGEWVKITFIPYEDGMCWFYFEDFYDNTSSVIVSEVLPRDCVSWGSFDNYQEYYNFLWN